MCLSALQLFERAKAQEKWEVDHDSTRTKCFESGSGLIWTDGDQALVVLTTKLDKCRVFLLRA